MKCAYQIALLFLLCACNKAPTISDNTEPDSAIDSVDLEEIRVLAQNGDASAQYKLGWAYYEGKFGDENKRLGVDWLKKSAQSDYVRGQLALGYLYHVGELVPKDIVKAIDLYEKAANQGAVQAMGNLGGLYAKGDGGEVDNTRAVEWYTKAAQLGDKGSKGILASMYFHGDGVEQNNEKAISYYKEAALAGDVLSQKDLGAVYLNGLGGIEQSYSDARHWYSMAADTGDGEAKRAVESINNLFINTLQHARDSSESPLHDAVKAQSEILREEKSVQNIASNIKELGRALDNKALSIFTAVTQEAHSLGMKFNDPMEALNTINVSRRQQGIWEMTAKISETDKNVIVMSDYLLGIWQPAVNIAGYGLLSVDSSIHDSAMESTGRLSPDCQFEISIVQGGSYRYTCSDFLLGQLDTTVAHDMKTMMAAAISRKHK